MCCPKWIDVKFGAIMDVEALPRHPSGLGRRGERTEKRLLGQFYQHRMARRGADADQSGFFQMMQTSTLRTSIDTELGQQTARKRDLSFLEHSLPMVD